MGVAWSSPRGPVRLHPAHTVLYKCHVMCQGHSARSYIYYLILIYLMIKNCSDAHTCISERYNLVFITDEDEEISKTSVNAANICFGETFTKHVYKANCV